MLKQMFARFGVGAVPFRRFGFGAGDDAGMSTAEYAIGTVAAAAFGSLLYTVVTSESVTAGLTSLVQRALESSF